MRPVDFGGGGENEARPLGCLPSLPSFPVVGVEVTFLYTDSGLT